MRPRRTASSRASRRPSVGSMTARVIASRRAASRVARFSSGCWRGSGALRWRAVLARDFDFGWGMVSLRWTAADPSASAREPGHRGQRVELAGMVVERVQQELLRARLDELAKLLGAVLRRAPDGDALGHPRHVVHAVEHGLEALEGRVGVVLDGDVDALGLRDPPARLGELLVEDLRLLGEVARRRGARADPAVAEARAAAQRGPRAGAEPDRRAGLLDRRGLRLGPALAQRLDALAQAAGGAVGREAERGRALVG